jgi:Prefoldin subunit
VRSECLQSSCDNYSLTCLFLFLQLYSKYKYMEGSFERSKATYKSKIPDIEQTLELIKIMKKKSENDEEMFTNYSLCDTIYAKAKVSVFVIHSSRSTSLEIQLYI